jgi:hypothetical protein
LSVQRLASRTSAAAPEDEGPGDLPSKFDVLRDFRVLRHSPRSD